MMLNNFKRFLSAIALVILPNLVFSQALEPMKVLFIGNSYTFMNGMPSMFEKMSQKTGKNILVEHCTQGGASFHVHSERKELYQTIKKRQWDYVILQGYSRELTEPVEYLDTASLPYINQILDSIYANNACSNVMFYMTWGYQDGYGEREDINTYEKMADTVRSGYKWLGQHYGNPIVPVGMVWKEAKEKEKINLYDADRAHPNLTGSYLIAATFYSAFFDELLPENYFSGVPEEIAKSINRRAFKYVSEHRKEYDLNHNMFRVELRPTIKESEFKLKYSANFPDADSIRWDFGDGIYSLDSIGTHVYRQAGDYIVVLHVMGECGFRQYVTQIKAQPIERARRPRRKKKRDDVD